LSLLEGNDTLVALAPATTTLAFLLIVIALRTPRSPRLRVVVNIVNAALLLRYMAWRLHDTLPPIGLTGDFALGAGLALAETAGAIAALLSLITLSRTLDRSPQSDRNAHWLTTQKTPPLIDVLICSYNEDAEILERTILGAMALDYPRFRVFMLDDRRRDWLKDLCESLGCLYIRRPDNRHAKAGNLNHALEILCRLDDPPDYVAILDADFVPRPNFLQRTMALFSDPCVGVVQTPQHFINPDPIQNNLRAQLVWPDEQRFFFDTILPSLDAWGVAFCCGTSSVTRVAALKEIGGFPTDSVTEDYLLSLRMKERGWMTAYLNEALTIGLAPEGLKEYITQRGRWCLGLMQIARGRTGPLSSESSLGFIDRLSLVNGVLGWCAIYPLRVMGLLTPAIALTFGLRPVQADLRDSMLYFLPYFIWSIGGMYWLSGGRTIPVMSEVSQLVTAREILKAIYVGLLRPQGQKFQVTAKGGDRSARFIEWSLMRWTLFAIVLTLCGVTRAFMMARSGEPISWSTISLIWSWYNLIVLTVLAFVCIEQPRHRKSERFASGREVFVHGKDGVIRRRVIDFSLTGARIEGAPPCPEGGQVICDFFGARVPAEIVRTDSTAFAVRFAEDPATRATIIRHFYASNYYVATENVRAAPVAQAIVKRALQ